MPENSAPQAAAAAAAAATPAPAGCRVASVEDASLAQQAGIQPGDFLVAINGHPIADAIDYWYHGSDERLRLEWRSGAPAGELRSKTVRKAYSEKLGLELETFETKRCANRCMFCFVHQLPKGMRRELYVKDEDYRLSFLYGNYITGTNLSPADIQRILRLKLSPIYFSVHATDAKTREALLGKKDLAPILPLMRKLAKGGIFMHAQIVLCPGVNDGAVLEATVSDLAQLYPKLESVAVVPVGLTDHRQRLPRLEPVSPGYARAFLKECKRLQRKMSKQIGFPLVFPSDEFFLLCGQEPPAYGQYPEIPQLENGVGMVYRFYQNAGQLLEELPGSLARPRKVAAITAALGARVLEKLVGAMNEKTEGLRIELLVARNSLFGEGVTVSGLLGGADFLREIQAHPGFDRYLIPANALRPWDQRFLDDMTLDELKERAGAEIALGDDTAESFIAAALGEAG